MALTAGFMTHITCRLCAGTLRSVIEYWLPFSDSCSSPRGVATTCIRVTNDSRSNRKDAATTGIRVSSSIVTEVEGRGCYQLSGIQFYTCTTRGDAVTTCIRVFSSIVAVAQ